MKAFFYKDKSGRGFTANFTEADIRANFELDTEGDNEYTLEDFLETSDCGDTWEHPSDNWELTRIQ